MIVHCMKSDKNLIKNSLIINICNVTKASSKEPNSLIEEISEKIFLLVDKFCINKYTQDYLTPSILSNIASSDDFLIIKESISELQVYNTCN